MNSFRFADPQWIHLLWGVASLIAALAWLQWRHRQALDRFLSRVMQSRLVDAVSPQRRWLGLFFFGLALLSLVVAAMRPQWGESVRVMPQVGAQIMVCLDVSKSMLAEDTVPNRLERAKTELSDLLALLQGEQVGLIAFAGKATVVSPMTTDFGFLKLILDEMGPDTVGRGGTRLEEPIRKAIDGFGDAADISRVILLITDGEDHDSFPLEAAMDAREKGIRIITIGFGDEAGSKIQITDRRTGARRFLQDQNGRDVVSRLDGETLREIALETEGAYIPAGTGALDLASIHQQHIVPLMRAQFESGEQVIRNEAYQWPVLAGLMMLMLSLLATLRTGVPQWQRTVATATLAGCILIQFQSTTWAQSSPADAVVDDSSIVDESELEATEGQASEAGTENDVDREPEEDVLPREAYNEALALLQSEPDRAEALFRMARNDAGTDGELRYRAAFNLAWVEIERAERVLEEEPETALAHLQAAADWFREAIRIRPQENEARHNLEITMRRILELSDALAKRDERDVAAQLDELIQRQRELIPQMANLIEATKRNPDSTNSAEEVQRRAFRGVATDQRLLNSDATLLSESIANQIGGMQSKADDQLTQEERLKAAQLEAAGHYLGRALQRLGQARSQFRRRDADRGFRRATIGLEELKRARDMLRDPRQVLQRLLTDTNQLARQTTLHAAAANPTEPPLPAWLTLEYLQELQDSLTDRTLEWAGQAQAATSQPASPATDEASVDSEVTEQLAAAAKFVQDAGESFQRAQAALQSNLSSEALQQQQEGGRALADALELFLDLRGLIEAMYAGEQTVQQFVNNDTDPNLDAQAIALSMAALEDKNLERGQRLERKFAKLRAELDQAAAAETDSDPANGTQGPQVSPEQLDQAEPLLEKILQGMRTTKDLFESTATDPTAEHDSAANAETDDESDDDTDTETASEDNRDADQESDASVSGLPMDKLRQQSDATVAELEALRRIFYTLIEHLRETAQRQADLNDQTQALASEEQETATIDRLQNDQSQLESVAEAIAEALLQQASQPAPQQTPNDDAADAAKQNIEEAGALVDEAAEQMRQAMTAMDDNAELETMTTPQDKALENLIEALRRLQPPQDNENQQQQNQQQQQQDQQQQQQNPQQQQDMSSRQLLQLIRDRESQRRKDRQRAAAAVESVEKDW